MGRQPCRISVASQDKKRAYAPEPLAEVSEPGAVAPGLALAARRDALLAECEAIFLALRDASPAEAEPLRRDLGQAQEALDETLQRLACLPWDEAEVLAARSERLQILAEAALASGHVGLGRLTEATAALVAGDGRPAEAMLAELQAMNTGPADQAARLALAQGLIAEEAMRWSDAARHYAQAARLDPDLRSLQKARALACRTGDLTAAFRLGKGLMVLAETAGTPAERAMAMAEHALTLEAQDRLAEAEGFLRKAVVGGRAYGGPARPDQARHLAQLARVLDAQDRLAEAETTLRKALDLTRAALGEGHPDYALRLNALASILQALDRDAEAEPLHHRALDLARRLEDGTHPVVVDCLTGLAQLAEKQGRLPTAEALYRQALEIDLGTVGRTHRDHAGRLCALAEVVRAQRRMPEAEDLFRQALEIDRATVGEAHRDYGVALNNLAGVVEVQGRPTEAEELYAAALANLRATLGDLHPATLKVTRNFRALIGSQLPQSVHRPGVEALWALGQQGLPGPDGQA